MLYNVIQLTNYVLGWEFAKGFYRLLDTTEGEDAAKIKVIEEEIFKSKHKVSAWTGSKEENECADKRIASAIMSSLNYEKSTNNCAEETQMFNILFGFHCLLAVYSDK